MTTLNQTTYNLAYNFDTHIFNSTSTNVINHISNNFFASVNQTSNSSWFFVSFNSDLVNEIVETSKTGITKNISTKDRGIIWTPNYHITPVSYTIIQDTQQQVIQFDANSITLNNDGLTTSDGIPPRLTGVKDGFIYFPSDFKVPVGFETITHLAFLKGNETEPFMVNENGTYYANIDSSKWILIDIADVTKLLSKQAPDITKDYIKLSLTTKSEIILDNNLPL